MPFAMNFTSVRLDAESGTLSVHGVSDPSDDPQALAAVDAIQIVVHGEDDAKAPLFQSLTEPQSEWMAAFDSASGFEIGDVVYVVGVTTGSAAAQMAWFNRFKIIAENERRIPGPNAG